MAETKSLPRWAKRLLSLICPDEFIEQIEGDLLELYQRELEVSGHRKANWHLAVSVLRFVRPGILLRKKMSLNSNNVTILRNYLKSTARHIRKSKLNFALRLGGLTLSVFCFLIIAVYVFYQLSFDTYHKDYQNIYRVNSERKENGVVEKYGIAPMALGPMLQNQIPGVSAVSRVRFANASYFRYENNVYDCELLVEADSSLFSVFTFQFLKGDKNALKKDNSIVLTRSVAERMFGTIDALQKVVTLNGNNQLYEVSAVIEDTPSNSSFFFGAVVAIQDKHEFSLNSIISPVEFIDHSAATYLRFTNGIPTAFSRNVESMLERYIPRKDRIESGFSIFIEPLKDIYRGPVYKVELVSKGSSVYLYAFAALGILLLVVACINYINLSIVDLSGRSREIGVRKVLGAHKTQLVFQIVAEIVIYTLLALSLSALALYVLFPEIATLIESKLRFSMLLDKNVLIVSGVCLLLVICCSAYFPASLLIRSGIGQNLKSVGLSFNSSVSRFLLFTQFSISTLCICCTLMVGKQVGFIHNKSLGFDRNNLIVMSLPEEFTVSKMITLKHNLKQVPGVINVSNTSFRIGGGYWKDSYFVEQEGHMKEVELYEVFSDDELFTTLNIAIRSGRTFDANMPSDSGAAFVINETAARELDWQNPVGKRIYTHPEDKGKWDGTVVGVVSDINISSLYEKVRPLVMRLPWQNSYPDGFVYIRYQGEEENIVKAIEKKYHEVMPGYPLAYRYVDEFYNARHQKETKAFTSLQFGTLVIVVVSLLGVFSLASFMSTRRMKEFGIRKVLGASQRQIAQIHISYFMRVVILSNCIALPIAYLVIRAWLSTFAYRIELSAAPFIIVAVVSIVMVIIAGSHAAIKAARMNPIDVIKTE